MIEAFIVRKNHNDTYGIGLSEKFHEAFPSFVCHESYLIFAARLIGMSYPTFLRYCAAHGGELYGKEGYPSIHFSNSSDVEKIVKEINNGYKEFYKRLKED